MSVLKKGTFDKGSVVSLVSFFGNIILFVLKYWAGIISNSVALIADAWHTLSDSISSIIVFWGFRWAKIPADEEHPFGHGRAELISSIIISVMLVFIGFKFILESVEKLQTKESVSYGIIAIVITTFSAIAKEVMARYSIAAGQKIDSKSLKADGWHHRSDAITSIIILAGILFGRSLWWLDGALGIVVSLFIFYTAWGILKETASIVIGESPSESLIQEINDIAKNTSNNISDIHHIHIHKYGNHNEITMHIRFNGEMTLNEVHRITSEIENELRHNLKLEATIHMEPKKN